MIADSGYSHEKRRFVHACCSFILNCCRNIAYICSYRASNQITLSITTKTPLLFLASFLTIIAFSCFDNLLLQVLWMYTAISIKVVHEQSGKVEYERERVLGVALKIHEFVSYSKQPFALLFDFSALLVDNLN